MRIAARSLVLAGTMLAATASAGLAAGVPTPDSKSEAITWGPVYTVRAGSSGGHSIVTTDNGMTVVEWPGIYGENLYISVRRVGHQWSKPTRILTTSGRDVLVKDGSRAWVIWQDSQVVRALRIAGDGTISPPGVVGPSSDPFQGAPSLAIGANGAMAAVWRRYGDPLLLAYRSPGGGWTEAEDVPVDGTLAGLVVGAAGTAQLVLSTDQGLVYLRRTPDGTWSTPRVLSTNAEFPKVEGDQHGDLVVGWRVVHASGRFSLLARYRAAGSGFGPLRHLIDDAPYGSDIELAMASDGAVASVYRTTSEGAAQLELTAADSDGDWLAPQTLPLTSEGYWMAMNGSGDFVVTNHDGNGLQLVTCSRDNVCADPERNDAMRGRYPSPAIGPNGEITLLWDRGCHSESCFPTSLLAQRGR